MDLRGRPVRPSHFAIEEMKPRKVNYLPDHMLVLEMSFMLCNVTFSWF